MQWTEQGAAAPCGVNKIRIYGHGVGIFLFGLGGPNIPSLPLFFAQFGPLATTLVYVVEISGLRTI